MRLWIYFAAAFAAVEIEASAEGASAAKNLVALFHPGPGKTGTTQFQNFLVKSELTLLEEGVAVWPDLYPAFELCQQENILSSYDYMFIEKDKQLSFYYKYSNKCLPIRKAIQTFIQDSAKNNKHVVLSSETFLASEDGVRNILDMLVAENYQIHGVITYRFYMSWFISRYGEFIKTQSITSIEHNPINQLAAPLFSDYLAEYYDQYINPHVVERFYSIVSSYSGFRYSIIDMYGTSAAGKDITEVMICDILGVLCGSKIFGELKRNHVHEAESARTIHSRQAAFLFVEKVAESNCTMDFSANQSNSRLFLEKTMLIWGNATKIPLRQVDLSRSAQVSLDVDTRLRKQFEKYFMNGNAAVNALKMLQEIKEVNRDAVVGNGRWRMFLMRSLLDYARKHGFASCEGGYTPIAKSNSEYGHHQLEKQILSQALRRGRKGTLLCMFHNIWLIIYH
jgi:hypothetical protein